MKGQINTISIVLIAAIIIALVGAAAYWAGPLLSKAQASTEFETATIFVLGLRDKVIDLSNTGGVYEADIPFGAVTVIPEDFQGENNNSILFQFPVSQPLALGESETFIGGASFEDVTNQNEGTLGVSSPAITTVKVESLGGTNWIVTMKILFRGLNTTTAPVETFKIALNKGGSPISGTSKIIIRRGETEPGLVTYTKMDVTVF